ncbi:phosphoribosylanthranilate isomerase [soil metagenome]
MTSVTRNFPVLSAANVVPTRPAVKICGITQRDQALEIARLGADFIGINFWPQSKRYLPLEKASWLSDIPKNVSLVGVFVNPDLSYLREVAATGLVMHFQLHGDESADFCAALVEEGLRLIKAFQVRDAAMLDQIAAYPVQDILLDAYHPDQRGGSGEVFPWELALQFKQKYPDRSLFLAGGLHADNVAEAVNSVRPCAVDVASGVEDDEPGIKNLAKVARFITQAKAGASLV